MQLLVELVTIFDTCEFECIEGLLTELQIGLDFVEGILVRVLDFIGEVALSAIQALLSLNETFR